MSSNRSIFPPLKRLYQAGALMLVISFTAGLTCHVAAQQATRREPVAAPVALSVPEEFEADLKALSQRMKVSFVVEGQPLTTRSDTKPSSIQKALAQQGKISDDAVREVADYYDYSAVRRGNVFVLIKLYTDPSDIPDVTPEEYRLALRSAAQLIAPFNPRFGPETLASDPLSEGIARLLSPQEEETLSHKGLPVASLSEAQREQARRLALYFYLQEQAHTVETAGGFLDAINGQDPVFHWEAIADVNAFGYDANAIVEARTIFIPLSHSNRVVVASDGTRLTMPGYQEHDGVRVQVTDPTDPNAKTPPVVPAAAPSLALSLAQAIAGINRQAEQKAQCQVDVALAAKRVMIVGMQEADPSGIMDALAEVYGLRVIHREDGIVFLTRRRDPSVQDISQLGKAISAIIPVSLLRALHARMKPKTPTVSVLLQPPPPLFSEMDYMTASGSLHLAAIRQLRALAEPRVQAAQGMRLPLSKLGNQAKQLFTMTRALGAFTDICWLAERPIPSYIADFDHIVLTGGIYQNPDGETRIALYLSYPDAVTGKMWQGVGFSNGRLPQQ